MNNTPQAQEPPALPILPPLADLLSPNPSPGDHARNIAQAEIQWVHGALKLAKRIGEEILYLRGARELGTAADVKLGEDRLIGALLIGACQGLQCAGKTWEAGECVDGTKPIEDRALIAIAALKDTAGERAQIAARAMESIGVATRTA